jgi:tetratricopeptide (TPR) repeat protein
LWLCGTGLYLFSDGSPRRTEVAWGVLGLSIIASAGLLLMGRCERWRIAGLNALDSGHSEEARRYLTRCLKVALVLPRRWSLAPLRGLVEVARRRQNLAEAEQWSRRLLEVEQQIFGADHRQCASALNNLACLCQSQQKIGAAIEFYQQALEVWRQAAPEDADCAVTLRNLGQLHSLRGNHAAAEPCLRQALAIQEKIPAPPAELSMSRKMLAQSCLAQGQAEEAEWLLQRACRAAVQAWGVNHPRVAQLRSELAQVYAAQGRYGEADEYFRLSLETLRQGSSLTHPEAAGVLDTYADFLQRAADIPPDAAQC